MPGTTTYVQVSPGQSIPVRVFVNRRRIILNNTVAINDRSIIKLSSINLLRLLNNDLTNLIMDVKEELQKILFQEPLRYLFPLKFVHGSDKLSKDIGTRWKCKVVASLGYLASLRYKLGYLRDQDDIHFLEDRKVDVTSKDTNRTALLTKELKFTFMEPDEGVIHDEDNVLDDKKTLSYRLNKLALLNNSIIDSLDLYVTSRPHLQKA